MPNENNGPHVPVSNWTLATGTKPGERHVLPRMSHSDARHSVPESGGEPAPRGESLY